MVQHRAMLTMADQRRHFQWPWTTPIPRFQGHTIFDAEYLINGTIYRHSFNGIVIGTYSRPSQPSRFEWSWVTKYSMRRSVARSLCDSWASCDITRWSTVKSVRPLVFWNMSKINCLTIYWDPCTLLSLIFIMNIVTLYGL